MPQSTLKISKIKEVKTPERIGKNAGFDFFVPEDEYEFPDDEPWYIIE